MSSHFHSLRIASVRRETADAIVVTFDVPDALAGTFRYRAGQYLTVRATLDGETLRRCYSICAGEQEQQLRIAIKRNTGGRFSSWALDHLQPGMVLELMPPEGHFCRPDSLSGCRHGLAIAAGSGITPVLSVIRTLLEQDPETRATLVYGNRASSTVMFRDELADLKDRYLSRFTLLHVMTRERQELDLFNGRIDEAKVEALLREWLPAGAFDRAWLCGPTAMIGGARAALLKAGLAPQQIRAEHFSSGDTAAPAPRHPAKPGEPAGRCEVALRMDGSELHFAMPREGASILEAALAAGIDMRHSCRTGVCATCRCKLVEGKVDMDASYALEDYEVARGFVLACQSYPASARVVLDFDLPN
jgi:ring-1,2-phenylacetyl-CoA epoxidase subunit PaaE